MEQIIAWYTEHIAVHHETFLRIILSAIFGLIIGWDREAKNKPAGLKTYMYVCVASALLTIISIESVEYFAAQDENVRMDPMRLAAQIVSGLGFLGAGVILKDGLRVKGLTSAAMILYAGGIGIGIGAGFYLLVTFTMILSIILVSLTRILERGIFRHKHAPQLPEKTNSGSNSETKE